jgi:hypothetical protein
MSLHITRFVDRLRGFEARGQREFTMPIADAKDLHADITRLLVTLTELQTQVVAQKQEETIQVEMHGGSF